MTYGPPPGNPPGQPGGGYGPPQGGQPGGYGPPPAGGYGQPGTPPPSGQGGQYGPPPQQQPPGQYGAPQGQYAAPQQQYGAPQGQYGGGQYGGPAKPGFDFSKVNPYDWGILGASVLALIFSFFSFYTGEVKANFGGTSYSDSAHESAWHGFFGWFAVILALVGAALIAMELFAPAVKLPVPTRLAALGAFALSLIFMIIALFVTPGAKDVPSGVDANVDYGRGFGYWVALVCIVAAAVLCFLRFQQTGGSLSALTGKKGSSGVSYGQPGYGAPQQQHGYQQPGHQPPAQQGYGAPAQPPPGYQQQPPAGYQQQQYTPTPPPSAPQSPPGGYQPPAAPPPQQPYQPPSAPPQQPPAYQPPPAQQPPPYQPPAAPRGDEGQQPPN